MADALGLSYIQVLDASLPTFSDQAERAVSSYSELLAGRENHPLPRRLSLDYVLRLARSYRAMAYMASVYFTCTLRLIEREARLLRGGAATVADRALASPSDSERLRMVRAHYRLQMVLHVWDRSRANFNHDPAVSRISAHLFAQWKPWELQPIFCLGTFYRRLRDLINHQQAPDRGQEV